MSGLNKNFGELITEEVDGADCSKVQTFTTVVYKHISVMLTGRRMVGEVERWVLCRRRQFSMPQPYALGIARRDDLALASCYSQEGRPRSSKCCRN